MKALTNKAAAKSIGTVYDELKSYLIARKIPRDLFTPGMQAVIFGEPDIIKIKKRKWTHF